MKKIVIMSDNHGDYQMLNHIKALEPSADYYLHCGDSEVPLLQMLSGYICVKGNNDQYLDLPNEAIVKVEDMSILLMHGHQLTYLNLESGIINLLGKHHCQILICGHTHIPMFKKVGTCYYVNPGSTSLPRGGSTRSYCVMTIDGTTVNCIFKEISWPYL